MAIWHLLSQLQINTEFTTPDNALGAAFTIERVSEEEIKIKTQNGTEVNISIRAFVEPILYLLQHHHNENNPVHIASDNDTNKSGPLCLAAREKNSNVRCINYILPILQQYEIVGIDGNRPNRCYYV